MTYEGHTIQLDVNDGIAVLVFDNRNESVNSSTVTLEELRAAVDTLKGLMAFKAHMKSGKSTFIVGADITEFGVLWLAPRRICSAQRCQCDLGDIEDLPYPSVCAVNGTALGGGFEMALSTTIGS